MNNRIAGVNFACLLCVLFPFASGCRQNEASAPDSAGAVSLVTAGSPPEATAGKAVRGHPTAHHGVLNAIEKCEIGHVKARLEGDTLRLWFVNGTPDTTRAVPVPAGEIVLKVALPEANTTQTLTLSPQPISLAMETVGHCSRFAGHAAWFSGVTQFTATGRVMFKGESRPLRIEYPNGYDPD